MARRLLTALGAAVGLMLAALVAAAAYTALKTPLNLNPNSNLTPSNCSPGPCSDVQGYRIWISNVRLDNDVVRMTVKFQNSSAATHASPDDLQLIDSGRRASNLITDSTGCNTWTRHEFSNGAYFGPVDICFRVSNTTPPFILHWSPDLGTFCCQRDITLWPS